MIEWVELKDFDPKGLDTYLICHKDKDGKQYFGIRYGFILDYVDKFNGHVVTHAAKINPPIEKTLEEKFEDYYRTLANSVSNINDLVNDLSKIAKEHYEGKE